jgi:putative phosphoserine phosphatase/1-acylglycerol-3-phosphate O-acyltransferase
MFAFAEHRSAGSSPERDTTEARARARPRLGVPGVARNAAAYALLLPSMAAGVAMGALNRDRQTIAEYAVSSWILRMFTLTGVKLRVHGEENLWVARPAVFIYNHRNNFDPYVAIKLVGRDWGSVAKKEIAGPLTPVMAWLIPNTAFIDRSSREKAIEGLKPVTELLTRGISVLAAPEGTRSRTGELGPFKKGSFRMAMEAGVPVVPIVIRNADAVATRGGAVAGGTVDVAVLPPVSVEGWTSENLEDRIAEVRQLFVDTLANWPEEHEGA